MLRPRRHALAAKGGHLRAFACGARAPHHQIPLQQVARSRRLCERQSMGWLSNLPCCASDRRADEDDSNVDAVIARNLWKNHRILPPTSRFKSNWDLMMVRQKQSHPAPRPPMSAGSPLRSRNAHDRGPSERSASLAARATSRTRRPRMCLPYTDAAGLLQLRLHPNCMLAPPAAAPRLPLAVKRVPFQRCTPPRDSAP